MNDVSISTTPKGRQNYMKLRLLLTILLFSTAIVLSGCFSIDVATNRITNDRHVLVSNDGWYLFGSLPLVCGNISDKSNSSFAFFRDDVTMDKIQDRFIDFAKKEHLTPRDMTYHANEQVLFTIPATTIAIPIPYVLAYRKIQLSGVLQ